MKKYFTFFLLLAGMTVLLALTSPLLSSPVLGQAAYYTPTAEASGNIYYYVQNNDTCTSISLLNNVPEDQILKLNNMKADDCRFLITGKKLLIAVVTPATVTPTPLPSPTSFLPTPTPYNGTGKLCIYLYEDVNGNGIAEDTETSIAGGAINITDSQGKSLSGATDATGNPTCFDKLNEGAYTISVAAPEGYNATTQTNYTIQLKAGNLSSVNFGAQKSSKATPTTGSGSSTSSLLAVLGAIVLLGGVGLAIYARRLGKQPTQFKK
jgi:LysM repeat protein